MRAPRRLWATAVPWSPASSSPKLPPERYFPWPVDEPDVSCARVSKVWFPQFGHLGMVAPLFTRTWWWQRSQRKSPPSRALSPACADMVTSSLSFKL
jgi:hypothetical protein